MSADETTPLRRSEPDRSYMYMSARNRAYKTKVRQFQCCVCAGLLGVFVLATVVTVSYMVQHDVQDQATNSTQIPTMEVSELQQLLTLSWPKRDTEVPLPESYSPSQLDAAIAEGKSTVHARDVMEAENPAVLLAPSHPSFLHSKAMYTSPTSLEAARVGTILVAATKSLNKNKGKWTGKGPRLPPSDWMPKKWCADKSFKPDCPPSPFRSMDGSCNNLENPDFGVAMRPFRRGLPADYADGISSPRKAKDGTSLPSAREVSVSVHRPVYYNDPHFTVVLAVWGQFVDHDFTATALSQRKDGTPITCCNTKWQHPECFPVHLKPADPFYQMYNVTCLDFVRSAAAPTCALGPREQLNQVSPFIDGSVVYGSNDQMLSGLRAYQGGLLLAAYSKDGRELLPADQTPGDGCNQAEESARGRYCFKSGDARANENLHLTTMHLIFARQHNRLAKTLHELNPSWNDERLFQESRRIVAAQLQHITYNEFLPIVIGEDLSNFLQLSTQKTGYFDGYNASINPQIANEFAASAFRFGHTLLQGLLKMIANDTSSDEYVQLHKMLFNPFGLYDSDFMSRTVRGALQTNIQRADQYFTKEVSEKLFKPKSGPCGLDLVSLNVQRGRDHGLQGFPAWREYCGFKRPQSFEDLYSIMDRDTVDQLSTMYPAVDDIDAYTGFVSEKPESDKRLLGPTITCIIIDQFIRMKRGDRYWYETPEHPQAFTPDQLNEIRKTTLSSVLCDNTDSLDGVQPYSMRSISAENPMTNCADLERPDMNAWAATPRLKLFTSSLIARPKSLPAPTAEEGYKPYKPFFDVRDSMIPAVKRLVVGATVVSGSITGSYSAGPLLTLWNGSFPAAIPYPFLDQPMGEIIPGVTPSDIMEHRGGALWGGSVTYEAPNTLKLSANYHLPLFLHGAGSFQSKWWCGEAELELRINSNSTQLHGIAESNFYSPILFRKTRNTAYSYRSATADEVLLQVTEEKAPLDPQSLPRFPVILHGDYASNKSIFWWNGNITLIFPSSPDTRQLLTASKSRTKITRVVLGGTVVSGNISMVDGREIWTGKLPLDIPLSTTNNVSNDVIHGFSALLTVSLDASIAGELKIDGTFSASVSNDTAPGMVHWVSGILQTTINVQWNSTVLMPVKSLSLYTTVVMKKSSTASSVIAPEHLLTSSPNAPAFLPRLFVILDGSYSSPNTYTWPGGVTFILLPATAITPESSKNLVASTNVPKQSKTEQSERGQQNLSSKRSRAEPIAIDASVTSGIITGSYSAGPLVTLWDGTLPAVIPAPFLDNPAVVGFQAADITTTKSSDSTQYRGGALWGGSIQYVPPSTLKLSANYHLPLFESLPAARFSQKWWCGEADLELKINWNSSQVLDLPEGNFFTPIMFKEDAATRNCEYLLTQPKLLQATEHHAPLNPITLPRVPVILHGTYNIGRTQFWWNGNVTLIISKNDTSSMPAPQLTPVLTASNSLSSRRVTFQGAVNYGKISLNGEVGSWWDGSVPFDITIPPAFTKDILHGGNTVLNGAFNTTSKSGSVSFSGAFSAQMTSVASSGALQWLSGNIDLSMNLVWNSTNLASLPSSPSNIYCMIFLHDTKEEADSPDPYELMAQIPALDKVVTTMIIILGGQFSTASTFTWDGNAIVALQPRIPRPTRLFLTQSLYTVPSFVRQSPLVLGGKIISGKVTAYSNNMPQNLWFDGSLPVAIPLPAFDRYLPPGQPASSPPTMGKIFHGHGILWTGSVEPLNGSRRIEIYGDFRLPIYNHGEIFTQDWFLGHLEITVDVKWNSTSLNAAKIASLPDADFYSPIRFRPDEYHENEEYTNLERHDPDMLEATPVLSNSASPFYPKGPMPRFPIILHGLIKPDRSAFMFYGNITMVFPYN